MRGFPMRHNAAWYGGLGRFDWCFGYFLFAMAVIRRFFMGEEYDCLMNQYDVLKQEYNQYHYVFPYIDQECIRNFKDKVAVHYEIQEMKHTYRDVVVVIMVNAIADQVLTTGGFHFYRGMLNPIGSLAWQLFHKLVDELEKSGYYSKEKAKEDRIWIAKMVKEVG